MVASLDTARATAAGPWAPLPALDDGDRRRVAALVARYGADALCHVHLHPDRSYLFAPDGDGFVSYALDRRVALLGGDPVCAPEGMRQDSESVVVESQSVGYPSPFIEVR